MKKLYRSRTEKVFCGLCGGIGVYFNIDPTLIRIIWVLLSFGTLFTGFILYFIISMIVPQESEDIEL